MRTVACIGAVVSTIPALSLGSDGGPAHQARQYPPVKMGTSGGEYNDASAAYCCGGTLGALVLRDGVPCILSNNHVLARSGTARSHDDTIQPGLIDLGCRSADGNIVGDFAGNLVPLGTANVDAALSIARTGMVDTTGAILDVGVPCSETRAPVVGMAVMKSGRTTGLTTGTITSIHTSVSIQYQKGCNSGKKFTVSYRDQVVTTAMSAAGDSGSLLLSNDGTPNPVGLLFAGSSTVTVYNPIQDVVSAFSTGGHTFSFVGTSCGAVTTQVAAQPVPQQGAGPAADGLARAVQAKVEHEHELMRTPGVWGIGVGADAQDPAQAVIVIYLEPAPGQAGRAAAPGVPKDVDGVKVRVITTDPVVAQ